MFIHRMQWWIKAQSTCLKHCDIERQTLPTRIRLDWVKMKTVFASSALLAAATFGSAVSAQTTPFDSQLLQIALQCETATTIDQCQTLIAQQIALLEADTTLDPLALLSSITRVVDSATQALLRSNASSESIAQQLSSIVQTVSTSIAKVTSRSPEAASAANSVVAVLTVSVLEVTVAKSLSSSATGGSLIGSALTQLASVSSDPTQANGILSIASTVSSGGSLSEIVSVIEQVSSFASPA